MQLSNTVKASILDAIDDDIGTATPVARFYTAALATEVAECALNSPAFNAANGTAGTMALNVTTAVQDTSPTGAAGAITRVCFYATNAATASAWLLQCGVDTTDTPTTPDITMSNNVVSASDTVQITSFVITCPAGTPTT